MPDERSDCPHRAEGVPLIRPPIVIDSLGALLVFNTRAQAEQCLAPLDVQGGKYVGAYDRDGRLLRVQVRTEERRILGLFRRVSQRTEIVETEHIPTHEATLRALLLRFIQPRHPADASERMDPLRGLIRVQMPEDRASPRKALEAGTAADGGAD
jgi:hypothetical protein